MGVQCDICQHILTEKELQLDNGYYELESPIAGSNRFIECPKCNNIIFFFFENCPETTDTVAD